MLGKNKYLITLWYGIPQQFILKEDGSLATNRLDEMFASGLNLITASYTPEINKQVLEYCHVHGVRCTIEDPRMQKAKRLGEGWEKIIADIVNDYKEHPALFNYHVTDEPNNADFPMLKKISDKLLELDPAHEPYINLFPNYASPEQLGAPTYRDHVEEFIRQVNPTLVSYDHYHFCKGTKIEQHEFTNERDRMIYENAFLAVNRAGFFDNIEVIRELSLAHGLPYMVIVLLVEHGSYRYLTEAELRWEVFQSLAYGSSRISYFTYWTPFNESDDVWHWKEGMISADGERCQHYYDVQKINLELQKMGDELLGATSLAVFHIGACEENVKFFAGYGGMKEINVPSATVGFFTGGLMLVANKDYTNSADVVFTTDKTLERFDKINGGWIPMDIKKFTLGAGDGELFRIG